MKKNCLWLLLALLSSCAPVVPAATPAPDAPKRVRILHTNDFHGRLLPQTPAGAEGRSVGGSAVLAAHFDSAATRFDRPTFVLSAGDDMQGTAISNLSWGRSTIAAHNAAGYDAAALGNHEFDWGQDTLRARIRESRFPWLAANLFRAGTQEHPEWVRPWTMLERRGVRLAVIGIALPTTPSVVIAGRVNGLQFGPEIPAIERYAREARAAGADFVVVTMHVGAECEQPGQTPTEASQGCRGEMVDVAQGLSEPVDLIVGGHTHRRVLTSVAGIPLMEAASYGTAYSLTDLEQSGGRTRVLRQEIRTPYADEVTPDTSVARVVAEWERNVRPISERAVVAFAQAMPRSEGERGEYPLGNLIADAHRVATGAHASIVNNGSIRRGMPAGIITYGTLYELQPFQNELVTLDLNGADLRAALENALGRDGRVNGHISGMTVRYAPTAPQGSRIREIRLSDGRIVRDDTRVTLGVSEFIASGGDRYTALTRVQPKQTGLVDLDALVQYLKSLPQPVRPTATGRWVAR
ncbi:5'-nucleotidase C-terminal domain-containing protein [soil metagenome]